MRKIVRTFDFHTTPYFLMLSSGAIVEEDSRIVGHSQKVFNQQRNFAITDHKINFEEAEVFYLQYKIY